MALSECLLLGGAGGALVEVISLLNYLNAWQRARRDTSGKVKNRPPSVWKYVDLPATAWLLVIRTGVGAGTATVFALGHQINGPYAALASGLAAPAILARAGQFSSARKAVQGQAAPAIAEEKRENVA
ncbi:hypothetical protein [Actinomadura rupiterrae]|uniref:hypothetical protein n=1 Tax=Actinomadura rupiterrae TaxID=559627 RepID=UPI0020A3C34D|nr:hypothetical protein [Actinomadura rupiterrae]MCP2339266.1 hypothetical protein [Actinomadura rupiterrae]